MKNVPIKELAAHLQKRIDSRIKAFVESSNKVRALYDEIEIEEKKMFDIFIELEPVQSLIYTQNPELERIFESLKRVYGKVENGIDTEIN